MKRIRYKESNQKGWLESIRVLVSLKTNAKYKVFINPEERKYKIKNINSEKIIHRGETGNLNVLKRTVRRKLSILGVDLSIETRDRTFGRCEKGMTQEKHENGQKSQELHN
jgi:hypothetical protein